MNILEIINLERSSILDDAIEPFLWTNDELIACLNRAYQELCRETKCIVDQSTTSVCQVNLLANQTLHTYASSIVYIFSARRNSDGVSLIKKSESFLDRLAYNWRATTGTPYYIITDSHVRQFAVYPKFNTTGYIAGSSNITFTALTGIISQAGATFTSHFSTGDSLVVTGTTSNNGTLTITNVAATEITVSDILVNENNTSAILQLVRDVALLRVARLPITSFTANDLESATPSTPEIDSTYHVGLLDGIAKFAYLKQDSEVYDPQKAERHRLAFEDFKSRVKWELADLTEGDTVMSPNYANI